MDLQLFDTHCHPHDTLEECVNIDSLSISCMALMGVHPRNWDDAILVHENSPDNTLLGFGVHPWFTHEYIKNQLDEKESDINGDKEEEKEEWYKTLKQYLMAHPTSFVGEIGLDKKAKSKNGAGTKEELWLGQLRAFRMQISLAKELNRPVSAHCVGSYGLMFDLLRSWSGTSQLPAKIALHSYGGTADMAKAFLSKKVKSKIFFGFSVFINMRSPKTKQVIKELPDDRILPETDLAGTKDMESGLVEIYNIIAEVKGWTYQEAVEKLKQNSQCFFNLTDSTT